MKDQNNKITTTCQCKLWIKFDKTQCGGMKN